MSLLMEALKKAEEAKRLSSENSSPDAAPGVVQELTLEPVNTIPPQPPGSPLPDLSLHFDSVDADLASVSTQNSLKQGMSASIPRSSNTSQRGADERTAVRNVFSAKQPAKSRTGLWAFLGVAIVVALVLGVYFWWQLQTVPGGTLAQPVQPQLPHSSPVASDASIQSAVPNAADVAKPALEIPPTQLSPEPEHAQASKRAARPQNLSLPGSEELPGSPVRLSKNQPKSNQTLEHAYEALQAGKMDEAQRGYEKVLSNDANNTDALLGLATIAASHGQSDRAQAFYLRALESDPNDATAQAGLINSKVQADPSVSESRLKTSLANQPDSSVLHFALGNLYARQGRWSEAQQDYFHAYAGEPDNADYIFNLAVSLDHLHQNKLAAQYYQMALSAAAVSNSAFDKIQAKNRISELQP